MRHFVNPYTDYDGSNLSVDSEKIKRLIEDYVRKTLEQRGFEDGDLYVGTSGIAFAFLKLHQSQVVESLNSTALQNAKVFIDHARSFLKNKSGDSVAFLCGNAGINAVSAVIHKEMGDMNQSQQDLNQFLTGVPVTHKTIFNRYGCDEILFGRAGYLSGIFWLNQNLPQRIPRDVATKIVDVTIQSGVQYSKTHRLKIPMMWECYGDKYLGAAHGISAILHMTLETPLANENLQLVKATTDIFLQMQASDGNFPCRLEDAGKPEHKSVHWCHGAPGAVYLFAKAFLVFKEQKYLDSCLKCGDLIWNKGLLRKGE
jgi:lantibiotic modifying enzyme